MKFNFGSIFSDVMNELDNSTQELLEETETKITAEWNQIMLEEGLES